MDFPFVVTAVAETPGVLDAATTSAIAQAIADQGGQVDFLSMRWLADDVAFEIPFRAAPAGAVQQAVRRAVEGRPVDVAALPVAGRRKRLLITDMDSTVITCECIDELGDMAGVKDRVAEITERAMNGELDFQAALAERVGLLKGLPESVLERVYAERVKLMPGARELVATMAANGAYTVLVSGGFSYFTGQVRRALGFHEDRSNQLEIVDGKLTGRVLPPILDKQVKLDTLREIAAARGLSLSDTMAAGDGANDLPMLQAAGLGIAYHAKPVVQEEAQVPVNHNSLKALLYFQGYHEREIVRDRAPLTLVASSPAAPLGAPGR